MRSNRLSRRRFVALTPLAAGMLATSRMSAQAAAGTPDISLQYTPNLDSDQIHEFVANTAMPQFDGQPPKVANFYEQPPADAADKKKKSVAANDTFRLSAAVSRSYRLTKSGAFIDTIQVVIPVTETVTMAIQNHLFIKNGIDKTTNPSAFNAIVSGFNNYDWNNNPDPTDYAKNEMAKSGVTPDMFAVRQSFSLTKVPGKRKESREQLNAILNLYGMKLDPKDVPVDSAGRSGGNLDMYAGDQSLQGYLQQEGWDLTELPPDRIIGRLPNQQVDKLHQVDTSKKETLDIPAIVKTESQHLDDCQMDLGATLDTKIATVFAYPEFMVTWEPFAIKIGCITVIISLPVLWIRFSSVVLYTYVGNSKYIPQAILKSVEGCAVNAVIIGAIIGIVLSNFAAALVAFRVSFTRCVSAVPAHILTCLIPGLALVTEPDNWRHAF
jgi:hypothetical protein